MQTEQNFDCDDAAQSVQKSTQGRRILLHDYCGHPFQLQLAEEFAARGHVVRHAYCGSNPGTPHALEGAEASSERFRSQAIELSKPITKGAFVQRLFLERQYGVRLAELIERERPDVTILANTPIDALGNAVRAARGADSMLIIWVQDLLGEAALRILPKKIGLAGRVVGNIYRRREGRLLSMAHHLVSITDDFSDFFRSSGIADHCWTTIPNWAPLNKIEPCEKNNSWAKEQGIHDKTVYLYSGSLGFKHNPKLILQLARAIKDRADAVVVVNSEGAAADWLRSSAKQCRVDDKLRVNGYQPFHRISEVLGAADVLLALLEPDAGAFSVPSKVLSNLCAARPQLLAVPSENLAAKIVTECESGLVCDPRNERAFVDAALSLLDDPIARETMGQKARAYALQNFQIERVAEKFESIFVKNYSEIGQLRRSAA